MTLKEFFTDNPEWQPYADMVVRPPTDEEIQEEFSDADSDVLSMCDRLIHGAGGRITVGTIYVRMRREGNPDRFAAMLACQRAPRGETSDTFWAGRKPFHEVFGPGYAACVKRMLARQGVNLKPGDEYMPELARFQGDPEAVVPFGGARSYIKNLCAKRGWACDGAVTTEHREPDSDPWEESVPLAPDLVKKNTARMLKKNPELRKLDRRELREKVLAEHGASK